MKSFVKKLYIFLSIVFIIFGIFGCFAFIERKYIYPLKYFDKIEECAFKYNLNKALILSVIKVESGFNESVKSDKNAIGLMQITEDTGAYIAKLKGAKQYNLFNANINIDYGCFYLRYLTDKFKQIKTVLVAFNAGEGKVSGWLKNAEYSTDGKTLKTIPYKESREYVKRIEKTFDKYIKLYGNILDKEEIFL